MVKVYIYVILILMFDSKSTYLHIIACYISKPVLYYVSKPVTYSLSAYLNVTLLFLWNIINIKIIARKRINNVV